MGKGGQKGYLGGTVVQFRPHRSESIKALEYVDITKIKKPPGFGDWSPEKMKWWRHNTARKVRNARIFEEWLKADDKDKIEKKLQEKWGFMSQNKIGQIVNEVREFGVSIASLTAEIETFRHVRTTQIAENTTEYITYLKSRLDDLFTLRDSGEGFVIIEEVEQTGDSEVLKHKKIPVMEAIARIYKLVNKAYKEEAETIAEHVGKPVDKQSQSNINIIQIQADKDFMENFNRLEKLDNTKEINA